MLEVDRDKLVETFRKLRLFSEKAISGDYLILHLILHFFAPFYGLELLLNLHITKYSVVIIVIPIIFITLGIIITRHFKRM